MTLKDIFYFHTIIVEKSITKAAAALFIAQPALSQCVQKLEKELDTTLLIRTGTGILPTEEGQCFFEFTTRILNEEKTFKKRLADVQIAEGGEIILGFTGTQATYVLPYFLPAFSKLHPNIHIILEEENSDNIEQSLSKGKIDVGIIHPPVMTPSLDYFELSEDRMVVAPRQTSNFNSYIYYKPHEPIPYISIEFLRNEPIAVTQPWQRSRMAIEQIFSKAGFSPTINQVSRNISTMDALAQVNYSTALIPEKQMSSALKNRGYYLLEEEYSVPFSFQVATSKDMYHSKATLKLLDYLKSIRHTF